MRDLLNSLDLLKSLDFLNSLDLLNSLWHDCDGQRVKPELRQCLEALSETTTARSSAPKISEQAQLRGFARAQALRVPVRDGLSDPCGSAAG